MISVVIATHDSERALVATLAALVPGAVASTVREVIVADAGSRDATAAVADAAGCRFVTTPAPLGARMKAGAALARGPWLMFLRPGVVVDGGWTDEVARFVEQAEIGGRADAAAAVFRRAPTRGRRSVLMEATDLLAAVLGALPRPEQGLLISKRLYDALGGHAADAAAPESDLIRRLGRRRIVLLHSGAAEVAP